ncbi:MAG: hypothetical protein WKG07_13025 [Hymenobacter sp.]
MFDLPEPFGPTTAVVPGSNVTDGPLGERFESGQLQRLQEHQVFLWPGLGRLGGDCPEARAVFWRPAANALGLGGGLFGGLLAGTKPPSASLSLPT